MTASPRTGTVRLSLPAPALADALDAVRFAAGRDPELPMLGGVLFDVEGDTLHLVATDRYRMAVARLAAVGHGEPVSRSSCPRRSSTRCARCWATTGPPVSRWRVTA